MTEQAVQGHPHRQAASAAGAAGSDAEDGQRFGRAEPAVCRESFQQRNRSGPRRYFASDCALTCGGVAAMHQPDEGHPDFFATLLDSTPSCLSLR